MARGIDTFETSYTFCVHHIIKFLHGLRRIRAYNHLFIDHTSLIDIYLWETYIYVSNWIDVPRHFL